MGRTVAELDATMSVAEFIDWQIYYQIEPFGQIVEDDYWRTHMDAFWRANAKSGTTIPEFFQRDKPPREETYQDFEDKIETQLLSYHNVIVVEATVEPTSVHGEPDTPAIQ